VEKGMIQVSKEKIEKYAYMTWTIKKIGNGKVELGNAVDLVKEETNYRNRSA
jgi:hypothetical protein